MSLTRPKQQGRAGDLSLDSVFAALSNSSRRKIMKLIATKPKTVGEIADEFQMSLNGVSKHLMVLEKAQLMVREKKGRSHFCRINPKPLAAAAEFIAFYQQFWDSKLENLTEWLNENGG